MKGGNCEKCGIYRRRLQRDHIVPKWKGGTNDPENIQLICANCHEDKTIDEHDSEEYRLIVRPRQAKGARDSWDDERRAAQSELVKTRTNFNRTGRKHTDEARAKIAASNMGKPRIPKDKETWRRRLSESGKRYWASVGKREMPTETREAIRRSVTAYYASKKAGAA